MTTSSTQDATFEPIADSALGPGADGLLGPPREVEYDPGKALDDARRELARRLIYILVFVIALYASIIATAKLTAINVADISSMFDTMFSSVATLVSAATGFYFGARTNEASNRRRADPSIGRRRR